MSEKRSGLRFILICLVAFLAGGLLRWQAGWLVLSWPASASTQGAVPGLDAEAQRQLQETVLAFYTSVDKGRYQEAYQLSLENKWQKTEQGAYAPNGLTSAEEFIKTLSDEIGSNGLGLNIVSIAVLTQSVVPAEQWSAVDPPELQALQSLPAGAQVQAVYQVDVGGVLLGRCSRWDWGDRVLVAQLNDHSWKLLLPGSPDAGSPHHEEWFLDRNPLKGKTIVPEAAHT